MEKVFCTFSIYMYNYMTATFGCVVSCSGSYVTKPAKIITLSNLQRILIMVGPVLGNRQPDVCEAKT